MEYFVLTSDSAERQGIISKRGKGGSIFQSRGWKERWFVLKDGKLSYFENKHTKEYYFQPFGTIRISRHDSASIYIDNEKSPTPYTFQLITQSRTYYLCAPSEYERDMWLQTLNQAIIEAARKHETNKVIVAQNVEEK